MLKAESQSVNLPSHSRLFKCTFIEQASLKVKKTKKQQQKTLTLKQMECQAKGNQVFLGSCGMYCPPQTKKGYLVKYVLMKVIDSPYAFFFFFFWNWQYFLLYFLEKANLLF